jgi:hypothetical protein
VPFGTVTEALPAADLCAELSADERMPRLRSLAWCSSNFRGGVTSHLDGDNTTERTSSRWVNDLNEADVGLASNGTSAGCAGGDLGLEWVVLVGVGDALRDAEADECAGVQAALLGCGDVALIAWDYVA